jgi:DNA-binding NtrC family response regulator
VATILVIDDEKSMASSIAALFEGRHEVIGAYNRREGLEVLAARNVDLVLLDQQLPGDSGIEVLVALKERDPDLYIVMITGHGTAQTVIQAIALGAYEYIEKPLDADRLEIVTLRALESRRLNAGARASSDESARHFGIDQIVGRSAAMQEVLKAIGRLVAADATVLVTGDSGTGKELVARALHVNGPRRRDPFVAVNCAGLADNLLDNELFGHEPQAYTGATARMKGRFEAAGEGTIFLDEIGDISPAVQAKLLRVLQAREFQRLGGTASIPMKARIVASTNRNLETEVAAGRFREDLYYRLSPSIVRLPPLRERKEDIPLLVDHFLELAARKMKRPSFTVTGEAMARLAAHDWPGNVRELENVVANLCIHLHGRVIDAVPPLGLTAAAAGRDMADEFVRRYLKEHEGGENLYDGAVALVEEALLRQVGERFAGNKTAMARALGISRVTLQKKLSEP